MKLLWNLYSIRSSFHFILLSFFLFIHSDISKLFWKYFWFLFQGSTRAFPPHHPLIPVDYQLTGQPVLIGGTMGTCSYVLTGTERGMTETFGSTCHGAVSSSFRDTNVCFFELSNEQPYIYYKVLEFVKMCWRCKSAHLPFFI